MALTMAGAAFASFPSNTFLNQTGTAIVPTAGQESCAGHEPGAGEATWHFVYSAQNTGTLNGHFDFSNGPQDLQSEDQGAIQSWWIITPASVTLDGTGTYTDGTGGNFNLSHTCLGAQETASPSPTPTPTLPQTNTIDQSQGNGSGTSLTLVFALILAVAGGLVAYAMRPRRVTNR